MWSGAPRTYTDVSNYTEGAMILDLVDTRTNKLVFRGAAGNHVLVVVREHLALDEVAAGQERGHRACLAHVGKRVAAECVAVIVVGVHDRFTASQQDAVLFSDAKSPRHMFELEIFERTSRLII